MKPEIYEEGGVSEQSQHVCEVFPTDVICALLSGSGAADQPVWRRR